MRPQRDAVLSFLIEVMWEGGGFQIPWNYDLEQRALSGRCWRRLERRRECPASMALSLFTLYYEKMYRAVRVYITLAACVCVQPRVTLVLCGFKTVYKSRCDSNRTNTCV